VGKCEEDWRQGMRWARLREGVMEVGREGVGWKEDVGGRSCRRSEKRREVGECEGSRLV
jgi:hypothetical protein